MNTLNVLAQADTEIQIHVVFALLAIATTPIVMWRKSRDRLHKTMGYVWVVLLAGTALSSFAISNIGMIGPFSPLHGLAVLTLWTLYTTIRAAIRRDITTHKRGLRSLATFGLGLPMVLNFLPDRTFARAFFDNDAMLGLLSTGVIMATIVVWRLWVREDKPLRFLQTRFA